ncbi:alpha/beta hydrolase [Opitutaceae bacterium EW11]|nr:alpha/beta hydrolase [Opitutaceae bacterium EW11]
MTTYSLVPTDWFSGRRLWPLRSLFVLASTILATIAVPSAKATELTFPSTFKERMVTTSDGTKIFVRSGGAGPAAVLLHGYGDTGDMWVPLAAELAKTHTVIVPDLRGMGKSSHPAGGYEKKTQAADIRAVVEALGIDHAAVVAHDIGNMVAYAYAASYPGKVDRLVLMDAPVPGIGPWEEILKTPLLWHFNFGGPDAERLVQGRERIYLDRFWNEFAAHPERIEEATRAHYAALYALPGGMRSGFAQFHAFKQDAEDNRIFVRTKLTMPVLAAGGEKSFGPMMATVMRAAATDVREAIIPDSGHWVMDENPAFTVALVSGFLREQESAASDRRLTPDELKFLGNGTPGTGTSAVAGIQTVTLKGDPDQTGLYTIILRIPAHTKIAAHDHPDDRVASVLSGTWYFGYGEKFDSAGLKPLPPGSIYTEPPHRAHFAETRNEAVVLEITGAGPSGTVYSDPAMDPRSGSH